MKILTFFLILAVSVSVYAKTEAGLLVTGFNIKKSKKADRAVANTLQNGIDVFSHLSSLNKKSTSYQRTSSGVIGFGSSDGALVAPPKKKRKPKVSLQIIK